MKKLFLFIGGVVMLAQISFAQSISTTNYTNPILHADYSDPDAIRVGSDYYMVASSFNHVPGLPLLHSKDLVNWNLIGYAINKIVPYEHYNKVQHGGGVWAPSIRYHNNEFYIYYPDPDFGIFLIKSKKINGPWSEPVLVEAGKGLIDPCPLWDDNGKCYLVHAYAGSRAGIKSVLIIKELNKEGTKVIGEGRMVYDGHIADPTIEGPKLYKRNGWYYIFAPAGGVSTGWQTVLRSKNIYGPYERKVVMAQGNSLVNGPHQGAWVNTPSGEDWFLHFQDKDAFGRVVHLQPLTWKNNWPVIGINEDAKGKGEPVLQYKRPFVGNISTQIKKEDLPTNQLPLVWQWQANPAATWAYIYEDKLRLFAVPMPDSARNYWNMPALLLQKFPAQEFTATTQITLEAKAQGERAGLMIFGTDYATVYIEKTADGLILKKSICLNADKGTAETTQVLKLLTTNTIHLKSSVSKEGICNFSFSDDGLNFKLIEGNFIAKPGKWVGAKIGLYCSRKIFTNDAGYAVINFFKLEY